MPTEKDLHQQLEAMRPFLIRFANLQIRNEVLAEDAVQDALMAVLEKPDNFSGQSTLRTYVIGILKFKIIDNLRITKREHQIDVYEDQSECEAVDALFISDGHTRDMPRQWSDPEDQLERADFFKVLEVCLERLPAKTARVFMLREWLELNTKEICSELSISPANVWTLLFRARLRLRECLDINWFGHRPAE
jgi:RNA polymerase sigma-70 factor (ECF subfamily)